MGERRLGMSEDRPPLSEDEFREALELLRPVAELGAAPQRANAILALGVLRERAPHEGAAAEAVRTMLRAATTAMARDGEAADPAPLLAALRAEAAAFPPALRRFAQAEALRLSEAGGARFDRAIAARLVVDLAGKGGRASEAGVLARWAEGTLLAARRFWAGWRAWWLPLGLAALAAAVLPAALAARLLQGLPGHDFTLRPDFVPALGTAVTAALAGGLLAAPGALVEGPLARLMEAGKVALAVALGTLLLSELGRATLMTEYDVSRREAVALLLVLLPAVAVARLAALALPARRSLPATVAEHALGAGGAGALAAVAVSLLLATLGAGWVGSGAIAGANEVRDLNVAGLPILALLALVAAFGSAAGVGWTSFWSGGGAAFAGAGSRELRLARLGLSCATPALVLLIVLLARAVPGTVAAQAGTVAASGLLRAGPAAPDCASAEAETRAADVALGEFRRLPVCPDRAAALITEWAAGRQMDLELFVVDQARRRLLRQDDPDPPRLEASARDLRREGALFFCLQRYGSDRCVAGDRTPARVWSAASAFNAIIGHAAHRDLVVTEEELAARPGAGAVPPDHDEGGYAVTIRFAAPAGQAAPAAPAAAPPRE